MSFTKFAIEHATAVFILILCLVVGGLISYSSLPREAAPDIAIPIVIVSTPYFGVSPSDMETLVTRPIEKEMKAIRGIKKMTSTSAESVSLVTLEFQTNVNIDDALQKVRENIDKVKPDLPPDAEDPQVIEVNSSDWPVLIANISGDMDLARLKNIGEEIQDDLEKIPGVLRVDIAGGVEKEVQVLLDPEKMRHHKVSVNQISGAIQSENLNLPGGSIAMGSMKYLLRVPGEFQNIDTIRNIVLKTPQGQPIFMRDVAEVQWGYKDRKTYSRLVTFKTNKDGTRTITSMPNISLSVVKRAGENIISIAEQSRLLVKRYEKTMSSGVSVSIVNDMSKNIKSSVHDLENNIISGFILVLAVLFFFMGGARNALMVAINIPLSMLITFIVLSVMGITLNMVVLFSLILALGMLVDNAIVIVENIYRHASEGKDIKTASLDGTTEVGWAIIASTMTTVGAFFPMVFWPGVMGKFMGFLPKTVIVTLLSSLFVALVINPTICAVFLKVKAGEKTDEMAIPDNFVYRTYRAILNWSLNHRVVIIITSFIALFGTFFLFGKFNAGVEFFPEGTPEQFSINIEMADGTRVETTDKLVKRIGEPLGGKALTQGMSEKDAKALNDSLKKGGLNVESWIEDVGVGATDGMAPGGSAPHYARITVDLLEAQKQSSNPELFMASLRKTYERIPGANIVLEKQKMGPPAGKPVSIEIVGKDLVVMAKIARQVKDELSKIPGVIDLDDNVELSRPEITVIVDREKAAIAGLSTSVIASTVRTAFNGSKASNFRDGKEEYDITLRLPEKMRSGVVDVSSLTIVNRDGVHIPLTEVAAINVQGGTGSIRHKDQERIVNVSANAAAGYQPAKLIASAQKNLATIKKNMPAGYTLRYAGETEDQKEAGEFLAKALMAGLFIIALILVTQFNSIVQPMIILFSVILSLIGVLMTMIVTREPFGIIMSGIGIISLAGVVVNNAIVLIDYANKLRERGMETREAVFMAGLVRFRPVLLTATTTVLGLAPLVAGVSVDFVNRKVVFGGSSVEMWGAMARVVSSGLVVATVLTLVVVPVMYSLFEDISDFTQRKILRRTAATSLVLGTIGLMMLPSFSYAQETKAPVEKSATETKKDETKKEDTKEGKDEPGETPFSTPKDVIKSEFKRVSIDLSEFKIPSKRVLTLEQARALVAKNSFDVKRAMIGIKIAETTISKAYASIMPSFVANVQGTINQDEIKVPFGPTEVVIQNKYDYNLSLGASLRLNPRAWPLLKQAKANKTLSEVQVTMIKDELDFAVVQTYYQILAIRHLLDVRAAQLQGSRTQLKSLLIKKKAGVAKAFELTSQRLRVKTDEKAVSQTKLQFIQARQALAAILYTKADFDVQDVKKIKMTQKVESLKKQAVNNRTSVKIDQQVMKLNKLQLEDVYYQYLPTGSINFNYRRGRGTALQPGQWQWVMTFGLQWVIWDGGVREAELDEKEANIVRQKLQLRQTKLKLGYDIELAHSQYLSAKGDLASSLTQVNLASQALDETKKAFKLGVAKRTDIISAEDQLRLAQLAQVQEEIKIQVAIRKIMYLTGKK